VSDGVSIRGFVTWLLATVIVWAVSMLAGFVLPAIFLRNRIQNGGNGPAQAVKTWGA